MKGGCEPGTPPERLVYVNNLLQHPNAKCPVLLTGPVPGKAPIAAGWGSDGGHWEGRRRVGG